MLILHHVNRLNSLWLNQPLVKELSSDQFKEGLLLFPFFTTEMFAMCINKPVDLFVSGEMTRGTLWNECIQLLIHFLRGCVCVCVWWEWGYWEDNFSCHFSMPLHTGTKYKQILMACTVSWLPYRLEPNSTVHDCHGAMYTAYFEFRQSAMILNTLKMHTECVHRKCWSGYKLKKVFFSWITIF